MADFTGGITMSIEDTPGADTWTLIPGLISPPTLGKTNPLVDVTDFDSTAKEYIGGLSDGNEISATFHYDAAAGTNAQLVQLQTAVDNKTNVNIQVAVTDGTTTDTYEFAIVPLSWTLGGGPEDVATLEFSLKISGAIAKTSA